MSSFDPNDPSRHTDWSEMQFETRAIRAGQDPDPTTGSVTIPIHPASTYRHNAVGDFNGYEYARTDNPTRTALQTSLASLEGAAWSLAYASGTAATREIPYLLSPGEHILLSDDIYSGTYRLFVGILGRYGIETSIVDMADLDAVRANIRPNTKLVWAETPTNPNLKITDIAGLASIVSETDALLVVDNTFATPYLQRPLDLGADLVLYSMTKYLGGHSDVVGGAIVGNDPEHYAFFKEHQNAAGATPSPFDCWLTLRGMRTLAIRMDRHSQNAMRIAEFLEGHTAVDRVFYPGLPGHPGHEVAKKQMDQFSGMVSFTAAGGIEAAQRIVESTRIFLLAESLGGVESLIEHPHRMTHISVAGTGVAVDEALIRLSVGIENADDLIADLGNALAKAS